MSATPLRGVAGVYRHIIDDVVTRVRTDFVQEGVDEAVLDELRELWESKLDDSGAIAAPRPAPVQQPGPAPQYYKPAHAPAYHPAAAAAPAVDLANFGKPEQYLQPTGFLHRPATQQPLQQPVATVYSAAAPAVPGHTGSSAAGGYNVATPMPSGGLPVIASQPGAYTAQLQARHLTAVAVPGGYAMPAAAGAQQQVWIPQQQLPLQQQPQHAQQHVAQQMAAPLAQAAQQQHRPAVMQPQQQYAPAVRPLAQVQQPAAQQPQCLQQQQQQPQQPQQQQQAVGQQPPIGGALDTRKRPYEGPDQGGPLSKQPYQQANGSAPVPVSAAAATIPQRDGNDDDEAGPLGAGVDDAFAGSVEGEDPLAGLSSDDDADGENIPNVVLAQFEKVSRTKTRVGTKWKCQLKNGIMHLNGRDIIFHKGNGEMQF